MNLKNLSSREWITIIAGGVIVVGFLLWFFVIDAGQKKLDTDHRYVAEYKKALRESKVNLRRKRVLD